jgi:1-acyl-sn-glycerol-3-phosphate acyltransferase
MSARIRLAFLWISQVARVLADNCLRMVVVLAAARLGRPERDAAWHLATTVYVLPFLLLAPVNGALGNGLPKRWVLVGASGFCCGTALLLGVLGGPWLACLGLAALGHAVYSPARYALLPAAARDTRLPLVRVNGLIEMGAAAAVVGGLVLGVSLDGPSLPGTSFPPAVATAVALNGLALLAALAVWFPSDVRRPERPAAALSGFFRDSGRVLRDRAARACLLGQSSFLGLISAGTGVLVAQSLSLPGDDALPTLIQQMVLIGLGVAGGSLLAGCQGHLKRALGLVPWAATGLLLALGWAAASPHPVWPCVFLGLMGGVANVPLRAGYQAAVPADARGNAMAILNTANYLAMTALSLFMIGLAHAEILTPAGQLAVVALLAAAGALAAWRILLRATLEDLLEVLLWPPYRVRACGPGLEQFPVRGPVLVVGNHACWFDPVFLGKVLPRPIIPMMTSVFYDKPVLRWLMKRVIRAIRVEASEFRREAPEIEQAISALDRGECVVIFPEGRLRRSEEQPLRQFGRGVWQILSERPQTPVVVCWIEGGWGSFTSYWNGPPTVNKRLDWRRPIAIGLGCPEVLGPALLADQRATRSYLMRACLACRKYLGLEPLALNESDEAEAKAGTS